ncbi:hypothetical protein CVT25_006150 [Psilocybe cyanescens]|uniref:Sm domain-containing protein n=1 Tax=Psilocybe cyanescens TaxID=93625 RepID=A0A409WYX8_PSICY|nr:hypothetical protein CVT25_006150 [Psilocybe cyanescens]
MSSSLPPPGPPSPPPSPLSPGSPLYRLQALLKELLRITTKDGRVFIGTFAGTDKPLNIILISAEEYRIGPDQDADGRYVGQVMLPWKIVVKVEAHIPSERPSRNASYDGLYIYPIYPSVDKKSKESLDATTIDPGSQAGVPSRSAPSIMTTKGSRETQNTQHTNALDLSGHVQKML